MAAEAKFRSRRCDSDEKTDIRAEAQSGRS